MNTGAFHSSVLKGFQGGHDHFATTMELGELLRLFEVSQAHSRQNRVSTSTKQNVEHWVRIWQTGEWMDRSIPVTFVVLDDPKFAPHTPGSSLGVLRISGDSRIYILHGQTAMEALRRAVHTGGMPVTNSLPVLIVRAFDPADAERVQGHFILSRSGKKAGPATVNHPHLDRLAVDKIVRESAFLTKAVAHGKSSLAPRSRKLITESSFAKAAHPGLGLPGSKENQQAMAQEFWEMLAITLPEWNAYSAGTLTAAEIRADSILGSAKTFLALGELAGLLFQKFPSDWRSVLTGMAAFDWKRDSSPWAEFACRKGNTLAAGAKSVASSMLSELERLSRVAEFRQ
jgi:hypothetical protein